jgi:quinol monooxygenase YgiN
VATSVAITSSSARRAAHSSTEGAGVGARTSLRQGACPHAPRRRTGRHRAAAGAVAARDHQVVARSVREDRGRYASCRRVASRRDIHGAGSGLRWTPSVHPLSDCAARAVATHHRYREVYNRRTEPRPMIVVTGMFTVPGKRVDAFMPRVEALMEQTASEPGYGHVGCVEQPDALGCFHIVELWESFADLDRHMSSAHRRQWEADVAQFAVRESEREHHALAASVRSVAAVATVETCRTVTVLVNARRGIATHCLSHRVSCRHRFLAAAREGMLRPAEWCKECETAVNTRLSERHRLALVMALFDATGVPDDATADPPRTRRSRR